MERNYASVQYTPLATVIPDVCSLALRRQCSMLLPLPTPCPCLHTFRPFTWTLADSVPDVTHRQAYFKDEKDAEGFEVALQDFRPIGMRNLGRQIVENIKLSSADPALMAKLKRIARRDYDATISPSPMQDPAYSDSASSSVGLTDPRFPNTFRIR